MRSIILLSVFVFFLSFRNIQSVENERIDVAIAFKVTDHAKLSDASKEAISLFLNNFTEDATLFGEDKMRVSVVQYSSEVEVLIPLQAGTSADAMKKAAVIDSGTTSSTHLKPEEVAEAVRKKVFHDPSDRPGVPEFLIIVAISKIDQPPRSTDLKDEASLIASKNAADVVQIAHIEELSSPSGPRYNFFIRHSSSNPKSDDTRYSPPDAFYDLAIDALDRVKDALKSCPYDNSDIKPCHYEFKKCIARVVVSLDKVPKYCLSAIPCPGDAKECQEKCDTVSKLTECKAPGYQVRVPKSMDSETVFYHGKCMIFNNYSSMVQSCVIENPNPVSDESVTDVQESSPTTKKPKGRHITDGFWWIFVGLFIGLLIGCVFLVVLKRRWDKKREGDKILYGHQIKQRKKEEAALAVKSKRGQ